MWKWLKRKLNGVKNQITPNEDEMDEDRTPRTAIEVGERIIALCAVTDKVFHGNDPKLNTWIDNNGIKEYFSSEEKDFFLNPSPPESRKIDFSWKVECLTSLLWATNLIPEIPPLNQEFDLSSVKKLDLIYNNPSHFKQNVQLRDHSELLKMEEHLYNAHWRVRDAQLFEKEMPAELDSGIVYERRYVLSWLVGDGENWDDVPTHT